MIIKQTRIRSCSFASAAPIGAPIYIKVEDIGGFDSRLKRFGFNEGDEEGTTILPSVTNRYAKMNAEPFFTVDKSLPKEEYTQVVYWTRHEWAGKGRLRPVTDFSYITKQRYHRDYYEPYSVCFTLVKAQDKQYIISDPIENTKDNEKKLINTVNMVLSVFGECEIDFSPKDVSCKRVFVNWEILPKGEHPWASVREVLERQTKNQTKTQKELMLRNCEEIYSRNPDFTAYGRAGFKGYAVFGFTDRKLYILESSLPNNATYVLDSDWEAISQLSKAEVLRSGLHKTRIVHTKSWKKNLDDLMGA